MTFPFHRKEMRNCFNNILIALNICDSLHLVFAIMDAVRNSFGEQIVFCHVVQQFLRKEVFGEII